MGREALLARRSLHRLSFFHSRRAPTPREYVTRSSFAARCWHAGERADIAPMRYYFDERV